MTAEAATFALLPIMKSEDCQKLGVFLADHMDRPVILSCAAVSRLGGQAAQVIAAHIKFRADGGYPLTIQDPSAGFSRSITTMAMDDLINAAGGTA